MPAVGRRATAVKMALAVVLRTFRHLKANLPQVATLRREVLRGLLTILLALAQLGKVLIPKVLTKAVHLPVR